jgi:hypothetical protein
MENKTGRFSKPWKNPRETFQNLEFDARVRSPSQPAHQHATGKRDT